MTGNERLARAVLLFFRGGPWTDDDRAVWETMTGYPTPTAATLCDFAREVLSDEKRSQGLRHYGRATMSDLYDTDVVTWSEQQADQLRTVKANQRHSTDWLNVAEEIEDVGIEYRVTVATDIKRSGKEWRSLKDIMSPIAGKA